MSELAHLDWLSVLVFGPLVAGTLAILVPRHAAGIGLLGMMLGLAAAIGLTGVIIKQGPLTVQLGGWAPPLGIALHADGLSAFMILMTAGVGAAVGVFASGAWGLKASPTSVGIPTFFWPLWMVLLSGLNALYLSTDIFNLFVTLEIVGLTAVGLTALAGTRQALDAALRYLIIGLVGSLMILLGVDYLYAAYGRVDLGGIEAADASVAATLALLVMLSGLAIKAALFPLHFWMPDAHSSATAPASAILSGLVVKAALYMAIRLWLAFPPPTELLSILFGAMGAGAIIFGSVQALRTRRLKMLVAYSTVAQVGLITLVFAATGSVGAEVAWRGAVYLMLAHAIAKAAMFLAAGRMVEELGHDRIAGLRRLSPGAIPSAFAFGIAAISLVGLPPSAGFVGKWLLLDGMITGEAWLWAALVILSTILSAGYLMRVVGRFLRHDTSNLQQAEPQAAESQTFVPWRLGDGVAVGMALVALLLGLGSAWPLSLIEIGAPLPAMATAELTISPLTDGADL